MCIEIKNQGITVNQKRSREQRIDLECVSEILSKIRAKLSNCSLFWS